MASRYALMDIQKLFLSQCISCVVAVSGGHSTDATKAHARAVAG